MIKMNKKQEESIERLKEKLHRLIRLDYDVCLYTVTQYSVTISFNHINSVYNGLAFIDINGNAKIDFQYHSVSKVVYGVIRSILTEIKEIFSIPEYDTLLTGIIETYHEKALKVYDAKFGN